MPRPVARLSATVLAALCAGALTGVAARALMRALAYAADDEPSFTWVASTMIVVLFVVLMIPAALGGVLSVGRGGWRVAARWSGITVSTFVLLGMSTATALGEGVDAFSSLPTVRLVTVVVVLAGFALVILGGAVAAARLGARWAARFALSGAGGPALASGHRDADAGAPPRPDEHVHSTPTR